jgi:hypothetical protein
VHGALKRKQSRCGDGRTLEMSLVGCMEVWDLDVFLKWTDGLTLYHNEGAMQVCGVAHGD